MRESTCSGGNETATQRSGFRVLNLNVGRRSSAGILAASLVFLTMFFGAGCSSTTGWKIPGTEKGAGATTTVYLVLENVETIPEDVRPQGEIVIDGAFFGNTSRPMYYKFVGNALVVGTIHVQKEKIHTIRVKFPGYEPFECARYFGMLPEYSVAFSLKRVGEAPAAAPAPQPEAAQAQEKKWYKPWTWFGGETEAPPSQAQSNP